MTTFTAILKSVINKTWGNILTSWANETATWGGISFWKNINKS